MIDSHDRWQGTVVEVERRRRVRVSLWAYAYEFRSHSIVPDYIFDVECRQINLRIDTGRPDLDYWFRACFDANTGMWVRNHPELEKLAQLYERLHSESLPS